MFFGKAMKGKEEAIAIKSCLAGRFDESSVLMLTSSPRSGSTWLGNVLCSIPNSCLLFEPLHLRHVPEAKAAGFSWRTFRNEDDKWPVGEAYLRRVFEGKVINEWTSRDLTLGEASRATTMVIKFVYANRLLPWICQTFEIRAPILLIRHPCAVIASQLNFSFWRNTKRPAAPPFIKNFPLLKSALGKTEGAEENLAALWALDQLPALIQPAPHLWIIVTYEELFLRPKITLSKIFQAWNLDIDIDLAISRLHQESSTVYKKINGIDGWKKTLTNKQVDKILKTIENFGLNFYTQDILPDLDLLNSERLAKHIQ